MKNRKEVFMATIQAILGIVFMILGVGWILIKDELIVGITLVALGNICMVISYLIEIKEKLIFMSTSEDDLAFDRERAQEAMKHIDKGVEMLRKKRKTVAGLGGIEAAFRGAKSELEWLLQEVE